MTARATIIAAEVGVWSLSAYPPRMDNLLAELIELGPGGLPLLAFTYATFWYTTPFLATSLLALVAYHRLPPAAHASAPALSAAGPSVDADAHCPVRRISASTPGRSSDPAWLTITWYFFYATARMRYICSYQ